MTNNTEEIKKRLLSDSKEIDKRLEELNSEDPFNDPDHVNFNAAVDEDAREQEMHQRLEAEMNALKDRQNNINLALQRLEKGTYGVCKRCNKDIPAKRLELIPETIYCVDCESELKK